MHELPVTESILDIVLRHAEKANSDQITKIHLVIGQLASIVDDSVKFYWDIISKGTLAEGAVLSFRRIPTRFLCLDCKIKFLPSGSHFTCPDCGSSRVSIINGNEFFVEAIDLKMEPPEKISS
jgi:hydrogenase nickel incorporation protein HypA/HybF